MRSVLPTSDAEWMRRREDALAYWRATSLLAAAHVFRLTAPAAPDARQPRMVGHWGCNPGIGWIVGHLASHWICDEPFLLVVGTGHASSYLLAQRSLAENWAAEKFAAAAQRYGQAGGDPSELPLPPGAPYQGGELGGALAVTQALAAFGERRLVTCVVGDGECETPSALAAFAHRDVLLGARCDGRAWLPVINANGARMGGPSLWSGSRLARFLEGMDYRVVRSGADPAEASEAAAAALQACLSGEKAAWISETEKGWPAPPSLGSLPFRGHDAHRPPRVAPELLKPDLIRWLREFGAEDFSNGDGWNSLNARRIAGRVAFSPGSVRRSGERSAAVASANLAWRSPVSAVDELFARRGTLVFCPDEARSNGLHSCLEAGNVIEVLSEETCFAWTWGAVEASREAAYATYEAFAPLTSSSVAQYAKLCASDSHRDHPAFIVLQTSLGWGNSPSHQNTDSVATFLVRPHAQLLCPVGYASASLRAEELLRRRNAIGLLVTSKQALLDLPDPGSDAVELRIRGAGKLRGTIVGIGDVCVTEAVAVMAAAARVGLAFRVVAVVELGSAASARRARSDSDANGAPEAVVAPPADPRAVGVSWCAARLVAVSLWEAYGASFPVHGFLERHGATPWETLCANGQDRVSLATTLARAGLVPAELVAAIERDITKDGDPAHAGGVPQFDCPPLVCAPWHPPVRETQARGGVKSRERI